MIASDVLYIKSMENYIRIITLQKVFTLLASTKSIESQLEGTSLVRVHKSYIVNTDYIAEVGSDWVKVRDEVLPVGRTYKVFFKKFGNK